MLKKKVIKLLSMIFFCFFAGFSNGETCSSVGQIQYKVNGTCGTSSRSCCSTGEWSEWDKECPSCTSEECWDGNSCEAAPEDKGKTVTEDCAVFGISYTCDIGVGWERKRTYLYSVTSENSCWDGNSCVAKPSECGQTSSDYSNCRIYTTICTCVARSGWTTSKTLTKCNASDLIPRGGRCVHPGGQYLWVPGESNPSVSGNTCTFSASSIKSCGSFNYAISGAGSSNSCVIKNYPRSGYNTRMGRSSGY